MKKSLAVLALAVCVLSLLVLYSAGAGYQRGLFDLGQAFAVLRWSAMAGLAGAVLGLVYLLWQRPRGAGLVVMLVAVCLGLTAFYLPYSQQRTARSVPPIHDISTDTRNPPAFVGVVPLRADAPNPPDYAGEEVAQLQQAAYPDLVTLRYPQSVKEVFSAAQAVMVSMGWEPMASVPAEGRLEATASTRWFGFKDDVVIRIQAGQGETLVDVRSKSRVGRSDVGANAARIRAFRDALDQRLR